MKEETFVPYFEIGPYPVQFGFTTKEKDFHLEMKRLEITEEVIFVREGATAATHYVWKDELLIIIVALKVPRKTTRAQIYGLLIHEAVHVWQKILDHINEKTAPGREIEAYHIQTIAQAMIENVMGVEPK
jgi:hypothetical protein